MNIVQKQKLIARPRRTETGIFQVKYSYDEEEFPSLYSAMAARSEALDKAGIRKITETEIKEAEQAITKTLGPMTFDPVIELCTRGEGEEVSTANRNTSSSDGIAMMLTAFAWINLVAGIIVGLIFISAGITPAGIAGITWLVIWLILVVFNFALLAGFARIIEYLRQIAQK